MDENSLLRRSGLNAVLAHGLMDMDWRHHATGLLQAYLVPGRLRVHIWDESLVVHRDGELHDHRRSLAVTVLCGQVENMSADVGFTDSDVAPRYDQYHCVRGENPHLHFTSECKGLIKASFQTYGPSHPFGHYTLPPYAVHRARSSWAVTVVSMGPEGQVPASVFCPTGEIPRHAFSHQGAYAPKRKDLLLKARSALLEMIP